MNGMEWGWGEFVYGGGWCGRHPMNPSAPPPSTLAPPLLLPPQELSQTQPLLQAAWRLATVETKKVLKRLVLPTDPQKKKEACR